MRRARFEDFMANTTPTPAKPKAVRARKQNPAHQTHGALPPRPEPMNMIKAFGIRDGYDVDTLDEYKGKLDKYTQTELHEHAHEIGIVPLDARDKLTKALHDKFVQAKLSQRPTRRIQVPINPKMEGFIKRFNAGELQ